MRDGNDGVADGPGTVEPVASGGSARQIGAVFNGLIFLAVVGLILAFAVRPGLKALHALPPMQADVPALVAADGASDLAIPPPSAPQLQTNEAGSPT